MKTSYRPDLKAHVSLDEQNKVRHIRHSEEYWLSEQKAPRLSANDYLNEMAETLQIPKKALKNLHKEVSFLERLEQGIGIPLQRRKALFRFDYHRLLPDINERSGLAQRPFR